MRRFAVGPQVGQERVVPSHVGHHVELEKPGPLALGGLVESAVGDDSDEVDEHVHGTVLAYDQSGQFVERCRVGGVDSRGERTIASRVDLVGH